MSDAISTKMGRCVFPCLPEVTVALVSLLSVGLAKRVGARLLLASTSEVYGGKWVGLLWGSSHSVLGEEGIKGGPRIPFLRRQRFLTPVHSSQEAPVSAIVSASQSQALPPSR